MKNHKQSEASMLREIIAQRDAQIRELEDRLYTDSLQIAKYSDVQQAWINAKEQPSKRFDDVIVCTENGRVVIAARHSENGYFTPALQRVENVIGWMPKPAPMEVPHGSH